MGAGSAHSQGPFGPGGAGSRVAGFADKMLWSLQSHPCHSAPNSAISRAKIDACIYDAGEPSPVIAAITSGSAPGGTGGSRNLPSSRGHSLGSGKGESIGIAYTMALPLPPERNW